MTTIDGRPSGDPNRAGRTALITGGSRGIGAAVVWHLARHGGSARCHLIQLGDSG